MAIAIAAEPRHDATITTGDGRRLAYAEFGEPDGRPVVLLHGTPGSRLICPDVDATVAAEVRLITVDRPGFGRSDPRPFHDALDVAADVAELAAALELDPFGVIGWSGGSVFALACAARYPDLVTAVAIVSGSGLADDPDRSNRETADIERLCADLRDGSVAALRAVVDRFSSYDADPRQILERTLANDDDPDQRLMRDPAVAAALAAMWDEGARQGAAGLAASWTAQWALPWGFDPGRIQQPTSVWHGTDDVVVPYVTAERLAAAIPGAQLHRFPGQGHLIALEHWPEILAAV